MDFSRKQRTLNVVGSISTALTKFVNHLQGVRIARKSRDARDVRIEELEAKVARMEGLLGRQWRELDFSTVSI